MGPALQVTHLLAFRLTPIAPSLRIVRLSDGPTLTFRVERYSLMKDILNTSRRAKSIGMEYLTPPLASPCPLFETSGRTKPVCSTARPRFLPPTWPEYSTTSSTSHEILPIALSSPFTPYHQSILCTSNCPRFIQRGTGHSRL